jgi:hypothetical protein
MPEKLSPGLTLDEVRTRVTVDGDSPKGKPGNPYLEGKRTVGRNNGHVMNMMSTGWGPSKLNRDESMPELTDIQRRILKALEGTNLHVFILASMVELSEVKLVAELPALVKAGYVSNTSNGYALMADGRRVVEMIPAAPAPKAKAKRRRA